MYKSSQHHQKRLLTQAVANLRQSLTNINSVISLLDGVESTSGTQIELAEIVAKINELTESVLAYKLKQFKEPERKKVLPFV